jgi:micrococcal nuclease
MKRLSLIVVACLAACAPHVVELTVQAPPTFSSEPGGFEDATVVRVVDGDTIEVRIDGVALGAGAGLTEVGGEYSVRLIGIDTPESVKPNSPVECFGREASAAAKALLDGASVRLVKDVDEADRYDRLLRYVYVGDELANARLVVNGYAAAYTYPPNVRHTDLLVELQRQARAADRGLWSRDTCGGAP